MKWLRTLYPARRLQTRELMDDPGSDPVLLEKTLRQFALVNRFLSRMRHLLKQHVLADMERLKKAGITGPFTVLDVGAGACDIPLWLADQARRQGMDLRITCVDHDHRVVDYARHVLESHQEITVVHGSAMEISGTWDYIICNHFLHHLRDEEIISFLNAAAHVCRRRLLVNDLLRSHWSVAGFFLVATLFLRGSFARADGITSIRKGFRPGELTRYMQDTAWNTGAAVLETGTIPPGRVYLTATPRTPEAPAPSPDPSAAARGDWKRRKAPAQPAAQGQEPPPGPSGSAP